MLLRHLLEELELVAPGLPPEHGIAAVWEVGSRRIVVVLVMYAQDLLDLAEEPPEPASQTHLVEFRVDEGCFGVVQGGLGSLWWSRNEQLRMDSVSSW